MYICNIADIILNMEHICNADMNKLYAMHKMFQVRHIYEHNMGVIDEDFIHKVPTLEYLKGREYPLERDEIVKFLSLLVEAGDKILKIVEDKAK